MMKIAYFHPRLVLTPQKSMLKSNIPLHQFSNNRSELASDCNEKGGIVVNYQYNIVIIAN
jgi:hypothetical protein